jgi:ubiquinone/menaquinone biosynthesis C-methylase UbiE
MRKQQKANNLSYNVNSAGQFWSKRLQSTKPLASVLTYNARPELNRLYDKWEKQLLEQHLPKHLMKQKALDIGTGIGRISLFMAKKGMGTTAVDISTKMLAHVKSKARKSKLINKINLVQASSHQLPLESDQFDIVTCFGLLEHLPEKVRKKTIAEAFRVLKPKGKLFFVVNNSKNPFLSPRYHLKHQEPSGYYVTLVGLEWLAKESRKLGLSCRVIGVNPWYGYIHYQLEPNLRKLGISDREFRQFCNIALQLDLLNELRNPEGEKLASHFMVEMSKLKSIKPQRKRDGCSTTDKRKR